MGEEVGDADAAIEIAEAYAIDECVGEFGEVLDVREEDNIWVVEFKTHTFSDTYEHRVRMNRVGNVFSHDRGSRLE